MARRERPQPDRSERRAARAAAGPAEPRAGAEASSAESGAAALRAHGARVAEPGAPPVDRGAAELRAAADGRALLAGAEASEILARIVPGDPLALRPRIARRLRAGAWLLGADRVHLRCLARVARAALHYRGAPGLDAWLDLQVDDAVLDLLREDCEAQSRGRAPSAVELEAYVALGRPLGLEPESMRAVCVAFNRLCEDERRSFYAWVLEGRALDEAARQAGVPTAELARRARRALEVVLDAAGLDLAAPEPGGGEP